MCQGMSRRLHLHWQGKACWKQRLSGDWIHNRLFEMHVLRTLRGAMPSGTVFFMGSTLDLSCYSRDGTIVDFARLPVDVGWGRSTINPTAVAASKVIVEPVHGGPNS